METLKRIKKPNCSVASIRMSIATWKLKRGVNYSQPKSSSVVSVFFFGGGGNKCRQMWPFTVQHEK